MFPFKAEERPQQNFDLVDIILEDDIFDITRIHFGDRVPLTISLQSHLATQTGQHMQLLAEKVAKVQQMQQVSAEYLAVRYEEGNLNHQAEQVINTAEETNQPSSSLPSSPRLNRDHQDVLRMSGSNIHSQSRLIRYFCPFVFYDHQGDVQGVVPEGGQPGAEDMSAGDQD